MDELESKKKKKKKKKQREREKIAGNCSEKMGGRMGEVFGKLEMPK